MPDQCVHASSTCSLLHATASCGLCCKTSKTETSWCVLYIALGKHYLQRYLEKPVWRRLSMSRSQFANWHIAELNTVFLILNITANLWNGFSCGHWACLRMLCMFVIQITTVLCLVNSVNGGHQTVLQHWIIMCLNNSWHRSLPSCMVGSCLLLWWNNNFVQIIIVLYHLCTDSGLLMLIFMWECCEECYPWAKFVHKQHCQNRCTCHVGAFMHLFFRVGQPTILMCMF